ncbi:hypothetical protein BH24ACI3_BH24ACI3_09070 [soil metagenome]
MKTTFLIFVAIISFSLSAFGQKGIDNQTQKIKEDANKTTSRGSDATRSFDWGRGKTQVRERLANPYVLNGRRDVLVNIIVSTLRENKFVVDEQSSRLSEGIIITQPFNIGRGPVLATTELKRYGIVEYADTAWSRGQYSLVIEVQSIDGTRNNVSVNAKVEGRSGNGLMTEWVTLRSSGRAEDEFLAKLIEAVTGVSPDPPTEIIDQ